MMNASEQFNIMFQQIQQSVPYGLKDRDSRIAAKYAMHIGALEATIKIFVPAIKQEEAMKMMADATKLTVQSI